MSAPALDTSASEQVVAVPGSKVADGRRVDRPSAALWSAPALALGVGAFTALAPQPRDWPATHVVAAWKRLPRWGWRS